MKKILLLTLILSSIVVDATVTVTTVNTSVYTSPAGNYQIDLDNDAIPDFSIGASQVGGVDQMQLRMLHANAEVSNALAATVIVVNPKNSGENFINWWQSTDSYIFQTPEFLTMVDAGYKYIGLRLLKNGNYYYGWVQVKVFFLSVGVVQIVNYAFEDTPNTPIAAGQTTSNPTNIYEIENKAINIYPNPVKSVLNIKSTVETKINTIKLYSVLGSLVKEAYLQDNQIDMSDLNAGIYYLKIMTDNRQIIRKIIKE